MRVAINGAGIAGPTLAWWLRHYGHDPILFEKAPTPRTGGYIIDFWGSGYDVAEKMGLLPKLAENGYLIQNLRSVSASGRTRSSLDASIFNDFTDGRYFSLARSDLANRILEACEGIACRSGVSVEAYDERADGVAVTLSDGTTEACDLLIGADGLHSHVRALAFGAQTQFEVPLNLHVAAFVITGYRQREELSYVQFTRPDRQINRVALRDDQTLVLFVFHDRFVTRKPQTPDEQKAALREIFGGMGWEADTILSHLDAADDLYFDRVSQIRMPQWSKGRVSLVGDAVACPSLLAGEGSGMAMTEAYVLAGELHRFGGDFAAGFAAYAAQLQDYTHAKQAGAVGFKGFFAPRSGFGLFLREVSIHLMRIPGMAKRLIGPGFFNNFALPDY